MPFNLLTKLMIEYAGKLVIVLGYLLWGINRQPQLVTNLILKQVFRQFC